VLTPHVGSATLETRSHMEQLVLDNLQSFVRTGRVLNPVNA
jgi:lactate dehydrogenase-like 2-hydroxyacid dehydrogenase